MTSAKSTRKVVRVRSKGQLTLPREFREALGIDADSLLAISLSGDRLEITPVRDTGEALRTYTDRDIEQFMAEDELDGAAAARIRDLLDRGQL